MQPMIFQQFCNSQWMTNMMITIEGVESDDETRLTPMLQCNNIVFGISIARHLETIKSQGHLQSIILCNSFSFKVSSIVNLLLTPFSSCSYKTLNEKKCDAKTETKRYAIIFHKAVINTILHFHFWNTSRFCKNLILGRSGHCVSGFDEVVSSYSYLVRQICQYQP